MLPPSHPLIEAATKPLAHNAEHRLAANALLEETFDENHPAIGETLERFEKVDARKRPAWRTAALALAVIAALMAAGFVQFRELPLDEFEIDRGFLGIPTIDPKTLPEGLTSEERLLIGEPGFSELEQKTRLYESDPDNPAYFSEYMSAYWDEFEELPPGYFKTVASIDPENSFFLYWAAGKIGSEAVEKKPFRGARTKRRDAQGNRLRPLPREIEFIIKDQVAFDEALLLSEQAATLPRFETYGNEMVAARVSCFNRDTLIGNTKALIHAYRTPSQMIGLRNVSDILSAKAQFLSQNSREEEFIDLAETQRHFIRGFSKNPDVTLINELVFSIMVSATATNFGWSADRLGLTEMSDEYERQWRALAAEKDQKEIRRKKDSGGLLSERGSILTELSLSMVKAQVTDPPPITAGELKPMRLADHDIFSRLCATAVALIIVIALAPLALFRLLISPAIRLPAIRLSKLMKPVDWVWVVLVGVILPIAFFLTINRFTPLGGRGYSVRYLNLLFPTIHFAAILLNLLLAPAMVIRWRLSRRLAPFGIDSPPGKVAVGILGLIVILAMCAFPAVLGTGLGARVILALLFIPALWLCLICFNAYRMLSGRPGERILLTAVSSALFPAYAAAIIALCATVPVFIASERYWAPKDTVIWIDPDAPDLGAYEFKVAAQKRKEINEILGVKID